MLKIIIIDQEETKIFQSESFEEIEKALDYFYTDVKEEVAQPISGLLELRNRIVREHDIEPEDVVLTPNGDIGVVLDVKSSGQALVKVGKSVTSVRIYDFSQLEHFDFEKYCNQEFDKFR